jgi:twinkle protein
MKNDLPNLENSSYNALSSRQLSKEVCEITKVKSIISNTGEDIVHFYPYLDHNKKVSWCVRKTENKAFLWLNRDKATPLKLFNQANIKDGGKLLVITEGVCDCLAAIQMLKNLGKNYSVVSVANGAASAPKEIKDNYEWVSSFENIVLAFDSDEPGQNAASEISSLFSPGKVKKLTFPEGIKDANDLLKSKKAGDFLNLIFRAKDIRSEGIIGIEDILDKVLTLPEMGLSYPWPKLTEFTYGYRRKEVIGLGGAQSSGKTLGFKELMLNCIDNHKLPVGGILLEEEPALTVKYLTGMQANKMFHIPQSEKNPWTIEELKERVNLLNKNLWLFNHWGGKDWKSIKEKIKFMVYSHGIKDIFLDHLTALVAHEADEHKAINKIMEEMASLVQELDCTIFYISHLRKNQGTSFSEGAPISTDDFRGSGAIAFWSNFMFAVERNQQASNKDDRNITTWRILKDRYTGQSTGETMLLNYSNQTGRWTEWDDAEVFEVV